MMIRRLGSPLLTRQAGRCFSSAAVQDAPTTPTTPEILGPREVPNPETQDIDAKGRLYATGRRKTAAARVWIMPGPGTFTVNRKSLIDYFDRDCHHKDVTIPFAVTQTAGLFDVWCTVKGGGHSGQAGAIRHGLSRAIEKWSPTQYRILLKREGLLTRDARRVERKKAGQPKARKKKQWVKR